MRDQEIIGLQEAYLEVSEAQEEGRSARKRSKNAPSYAEVKAGIDSKEKESAERKAERASARRPLTPGERYEQEKAARAKKGSSGYGYSQHLMGGSQSSSNFNPRSVREEVLSYLLDEGFASDEKSAKAIMGAMSETWVESIMEQKKHSLETEAGNADKRNKSYASKKFKQTVDDSPFNPNSSKWDPEGVESKTHSPKSYR